jgi:glycosyltransferase involved in cell wall biosynthesis
MKALVIAPQPFFTPRGTPFSVYYRTLMLAQQGVVMDFLTYGQGEDVDIPGVRFVRTPAFRVFGKIGIGPSLFKLFLDFFIFWQMLWLLLWNRYDFVHAHEEAVFFARLVKPIFRFKLVYDMHSSLAQQMHNFNYSKSRLIVGTFKHLEDGALKSAEAVITICPDLRDYVNGIIDEPRKHFLIENSLFMPVRLKNPRAPRAQGEGERAGAGDDAGQLATRIKREGHPLIVYAGTLEHYQGIDLLIGAVAEVAKTLPAVRCLVVGGTEAQVARYRESAAKQDASTHVLFTGQMPQAVAKHALAQADILVSPRTEGTNTPLKVYEQLASGIPLVATAIHSHTQVLNDEVAFLAEPHAETFGEALLTTLRESERARAKAANAQRLYRERYAEEAYREKILKLLDWLRQR